MRLLALGAMALALGLGGCMHGMGGEHHDGMMGSMMGQHASGDCPGAEEAQHGAGAQADDQAQHEHQAGAAECPRANRDEPQQHEHGQQPQPN